MGRGWGSGGGRRGGEESHQTCTWLWWWAWLNMWEEGEDWEKRVLTLLVSLVMEWMVMLEIPGCET